MEDLPAYLMHDQPTTCPDCGRRTEWFGEEPQIHLCVCGYHFLVYEDEDFGLVETEHGWVPELEALADLDFETSLDSQEFPSEPHVRHRAQNHSVTRLAPYPRLQKPAISMECQI